MEAGRRSTLRRRPLADCTNTVNVATRRKSSSSPAKYDAGVIKPPKSVAVAATKPKPKPKPKPRPPISGGSIETNTSTGSNNPSNVSGAISIPPSSDPPAPPTPLSESGGRDRRKIGPSATQGRQDDKTTKDKGKMPSETPTIQSFMPAVRQVLLRSVSTASGPAAAQSQKLDAQKTMDKQKMVLGSLNIDTTELLRPPIPLASSSNAATNFRLSRPHLVQIRKLDAQKMKDKGKMVLQSPNTGATNLLRPHISLASSSAAADSSRLSEPATVQNQILDAQKRKDKGKMVVETPIIEPTDLFRSHLSLASSSAAGSSFRLAEPQTIHNQKLSELNGKEKGKMVLETSDIETNDLLRPHIAQASSSGAASNCHPSGPHVVHHRTLDAQRTDKGKGKIVIETSNIEMPPILRSSTSLASSSATSGNCRVSEPLAVQYQKRDAQERSDKAKGVLQTLNMSKTDFMGVHFPQTSSSAGSSSHLSRPPVDENQKLDATKSKDEGKLVQNVLDSETTEPLTPHALLASSSAASGTHDQERLGSLTVYNRGRTLRTRKHADGKSMTFSCPPNKRMKEGIVLGDDYGKRKSGSHTDPLPGHKKKRSRNDQHKKSVHTMSQDEIERIRAYYAEIDAFELPEEDASDFE